MMNFLAGMVVAGFVLIGSAFGYMAMALSGLGRNVLEEEKKGDN